MQTKHDEIQQEIVEKALKFYKTERLGYIDGAMRLGKIKISIDILKRLFLYNLHDVLIAYPDNNIKQSWIDEFKKWGYDDLFVTYTNFSSLHKYKDSKASIFIIDEFHKCSEMERDYCHQIMTNSKDTKVLGLSGTISKWTKGVWGLKEIAKYTTLEAIEAGIIADYRVTVHFVPLDTKIKTPNKKGRMLSEKQKYDNYTFVIKKFAKEGKDTMHLALSRNRLSTSSLGKLNYVKNLLLSLNDKRIVIFAGLTDTADKLGIPTYHNKSESDENFQRFQREEINHLGLAQMGKMGVSFKKLDSVIIMNATHNMEDTAQIANRCIQLDYNGKIADIHVIALNEEVEIDKVKKSLSMLDKKRIKYL